MPKKSCILLILTILAMLSIFLCGCTDNVTSEKAVTLSSIEVVESTVPKDALKDAVDVSRIQIQLNYSNGESERMTIEESMLTEDSRQKLTQVGTQVFTVVYNKKTAKFQMEIHDVSPVYYSLRIYGGVPTYINHTKLLNPISLNGEYYENVYLDGTVVTIEWVIIKGQNFSYWTANDLQVSTESIVEVTVDSDLVYRPYYSAAVSTVSFNTFSTSTIQSKTIDVLYESDIMAVTKDNYIFAGWTTDVITEEQSLSGYNKNIVRFPFNVGRDITFYATWIPMGVVYTQVDDHYEVTGYKGKANSLYLPEIYQGLPVTKICANAFSGDNAAKLTTLSISSSVQTIEEGAFVGCTHLESFIVEDSDYFKVEEGVLYTNNGSALVCYPQNKLTAYYFVPSSVKEVFGYAFYNALVGSIKLPLATESIGIKAFDSLHIDHVDLSSITPSNLSLGGELFNSYLRALVISPSDEELYLLQFPVINAVRDKIVTSLADTNTVYDYSYEEADGLTMTLLYRIIYDKNLVDEGTVTSDEESYATAEIIGANRMATTFAVPIRLSQPGQKSYLVTSLADRAMKDCTLLETVVISLSSRLERIGEDVFTDTPWLETVGDTLSANKTIYKYLGNAETYIMDENVVKIAEGAFRNKTSLKYVNIGSGISLTKISAYAFDNCTSLVGFICDANPRGDGIYLKYPVRTIGDYAFRNTAITYVKLQPSTTQQSNLLSTIGKYAFAGCKYLLSVTLSRSTTNIAETAFIGCISLREFVLPERNSVFEVYEGILYSYSSDGKYTLFSYPAARLDGEFDPTYVRSYASTFEYNLEEYEGKSDVDVGSAIFAGTKRMLHLVICTNEEWKKEYDTTTEKYVLLTKSGRSLQPCTVVDKNPDGTLVTDGDFYFGIYVDNSEFVPLLYDAEKDSYYYYPMRRQYVSIVSLDLSLYIDSGDPNVGSISFSNQVYYLYIWVRSGLEIISVGNSVPVDKNTNQGLKQNTVAVYNDDGTLDESYLDGDFYYYFYADMDKSKKILLFYDIATSKYYYKDYLNVTAIGSYAFSYSAVSAVVIPSQITSIGENAFCIPGMNYLKFLHSPTAFSYNAIFADYTPDYIILSEEVSASDRLVFFDSSLDLMTQKVGHPNYTFFTDDSSDNVLYMAETDGNNTYLYVVGTSRVAASIVLPETVRHNGVSYTQSKTVLPYAFYGVYLNAATLRNVTSLASHAFSECYQIQSLYIETDFINDLQDDTFGSRFHNGMYIYDSQNGLNLYRESKWVRSGDLFTYTDVDGTQRSGCRYLILDDSQSPFAVIRYEDEEGNYLTVDIFYGKVSVGNVLSVQQTIARAGWNISGWTDDEGNDIAAGSDYYIPYNQVLTCVWMPQTYKVYFVISEGEVKRITDGTATALPVKVNSSTGLITYSAEVTFAQDYSFSYINYDVLRKNFVCWRDSQSNMFQTSGTWNFVVDSYELYLYPVLSDRLYQLVYSVDSDVTIASSSYMLTYAASQFTLTVPTTTTYSFLGWYMLEDPEGGDLPENRIILTDGNGRSKISWLYSGRENYVLYALWDSVVLYPYGVGINSDFVRYGEAYQLSVPEDDDFDGWYVEFDNGEREKITDKNGVSYSAWLFDGKREYSLYREGNE